MIKYVKGDATAPIGDGDKLIIHCCNDVGAWGSGFVIAISNKWKEPEREYIKWYKGYFQHNKFKLGNIQVVQVSPDICVVNMIGQHNIIQRGEEVPVRYEAIRECLQKVAVTAINDKFSVHAPRFGSDRAGGKWEIIEKIINEELINTGIAVTIYDL